MATPASDALDRRRIIVHILQPALARVYRIADGRALGGECAKCIHPDDIEACIATRTRACEERREFELEYRLRRADDEYRWVLENARLASVRGAFAGFVASCNDITDRRREQEEALARQKLEASDCWPRHRARLNNLLGSILADAELALGLSRPADGSEEVSRIRAVAIAPRRLSRIDDLRRAGKANPQPVDLSLLVEEMLHCSRP